MIDWLKSFFSPPGAQVRPKLLDDVQLIATGWEEQEERDAIRTWRNSQGAVLTLIYKQLQRPAFIFTGMLWMPVAGQWLIWATIDGERGTTGVREAAVTARLFNAGELSVDAYQESWARDPYDPTYNGVDHSTLRYVSDDDKYDADFPFHPLSKVRRTLRQISAAESIQSFHVY